MTAKDVTPSEVIGWKLLREEVLKRDGHRCRNCASDKHLEVHHLQPVAAESDGVDENGYALSGDRRIVPASGLLTLCKLCHDALHEARVISRHAVDVSLLGPVPAQEREWNNIFELWELNGRVLPFKVMREGWNQELDHFTLVERVEIKRWPYGFAWGRYIREGKAGEQQKIGGAGSYQWRLIGRAPPN